MNKFTAYFFLFVTLLLPNLTQASSFDAKIEFSNAKKLCLAKLGEDNLNQWEKITLEDGTIIVCGKGEKTPWSETTGPEITVLTETGGRTCASTAYNLSGNLQTLGISAGETARTLIVIMGSVLEKMKETGRYDYEITDALFRQINELLPSLDWIVKDSGWYILGEADSALSRLSYMGRLYGKRYGMQVISLFNQLIVDGNARYRDNEAWSLYYRKEILKNLYYAINGLILISDTLPDWEKPTKQEMKELAKTYLEFIKAYPEKHGWLSKKEIEVLADTDPDILAEIRKLETKREETANLKNVTEEAEKEWQKKQPDIIDTVEN
ncbi:MAG: hypothetical protein HYW79_04000 [Parcubacteria group bacterium]|nr:hypothetical protein [Parcubacteria group bacterium]